VRSGLVREQRSLFSTLERARNFEGSSKGYAGEARGANIWATPPWPAPSWTGSCTAARCWSSRARVTDWRRPPHASPPRPY